MESLLFYIGIVVIASLVVWKASGLLEKSAQSLSKFYKLPPLVQGTIITAVGSSFPELSTTVVSTLIHGEFDLGVAAIVGSAIFNILVIPGLSGVIAGKISTDRILVYKDAQFYITSVAVLLLTFSIAVIYFPVESDQIKGEVNRTIALIPVALYLLYLFLQQQDTRDFQREKKEKKQEGEESQDEEEEVNVGKEWLKLLASLALIIGGVEGLVRSAIFFGDYFQTPNFFWGVTIVAAATSIPDAFVSVRVAIEDKGTVSIGNVLGSNIFDLLIAIPAGVLIAGSSVVNFSVAVPMLLFLTVATIALFAFLRTGLYLKKWESWLLLLFYVLFIAWMALETFDVINWVPN